MLSRRVMSMLRQRSRPMMIYRFSSSSSWHHQRMGTVTTRSSPCSLLASSSLSSSSSSSSPSLSSVRHYATPSRMICLSSPGASSSAMSPPAYFIPLPTSSELPSSTSSSPSLKLYDLQMDFNVKWVNVMAAGMCSLSFVTAGYLLDVWSYIIPGVVNGGDGVGIDSQAVASVLPSDWGSSTVAGLAILYGVIVGGATRWLNRRIPSQIHLLPDRQLEIITLSGSSHYYPLDCILPPRAIRGPVIDHYSFIWLDVVEPSSDGGVVSYLIDHRRALHIQKLAKKQQRNENSSSSSTLFLSSTLNFPTARGTFRHNFSCFDDVIDGDTEAAHAASFNKNQGDLEIMQDVLTYNRCGGVTRFRDGSRSGGSKKQNQRQQQQQHQHQHQHHGHGHGRRLQQMRHPLNKEGVWIP